MQLALTASLPVLAVAACSAPPTPVAPMPAGPVACAPSQLELRLDDGQGRFNGMSHSGTMLVVRNVGQAPCTIPARPLPRFADANRQPVDISARETSGQPAQSASASAAITLAPGAGVDSDLRWVSNNVFDNGHCEAPAFLGLALGAQTIYARFAGHLCGAGGQPSTFTATAFRPDAGDQSKPSPPASAAGGSLAPQGCMGAGMPPETEWAHSECSWMWSGCQAGERRVMESPSAGMVLRTCRSVGIVYAWPTPMPAAQPASAAQAADLQCIARLAWQVLAAVPSRGGSNQ